MPYSALSISTQDELTYLASLSFFKNDFLDYLSDFQLHREHIFIRSLSDGDIDLRFKGPLLDICLFEVYALAIISELNSFNH